MREPRAVVDANYGLHCVAMQIIGRAKLLLAAGGALVKRHLNLEFERHQVFVLQFVRVRLPTLGLGRKILAAVAAQVLLEDHAFYLPRRDLRLARAELVSQPYNEVAMDRCLVALRALADTRDPRERGADPGGEG